MNCQKYPAFSKKCFPRILVGLVFLTLWHQTYFDRCFSSMHLVLFHIPFPVSALLYLIGWINLPVGAAA
jgi:hypothetical protein